MHESELFPEKAQKLVELALDADGPTQSDSDCCCQKTIASLLLDSNLSETEKLSQIKKTIQKLESKSEIDRDATKVNNDEELHGVHQFIMELLPKQQKGKGNIFLHYLLKNVTLTPDNRVLYPDGEVGSSVLDVVRYFVTSIKLPVKMPVDGIKLANLIHEWSFPYSAFGFGKHPNELLQNYPHSQHATKNGQQQSVEVVSPSKWISLY